MASSSQELVTYSSNNPAALQLFEAVLRGDKELPRIEEDPEIIQQEILDRILSAESDEELESFGSAIPWQERLNVPMEIHGFRFRPSDYKEGAPVFVVVDATNLQTGSNEVLTTGSLAVMGILLNLAKRDRFPVIRMLVEGKETKSHNTPLWLVTPDPARVAVAEAMADESNPLDEEN